MAFESGFVPFYYIEIKRKIDVDISDSPDLVKLKAIWLTLSKKIKNLNDACQKFKDRITCRNLWRY